MRSVDGYQDAEPEIGSRRGRNAESDVSSSKKLSMKMAAQDGETLVRGKNRVERGLHEGEYEKVQDKDLRYTERKEGSRERGGHGSREQERSSSKRRWDEVDPSRKNEESAYGERSESRKSDHSMQSRDRVEIRNELAEGKTKYAEPSAEKNVKSGTREDKRVDAERSKSRARPDSVDEDSRHNASGRESRQESSKDDKQRMDKERDKLVDVGGINIHKSSSRLHAEKVDKHKNQRELTQASRDDADARERGAKNDEDGHSRMRDRSSRQAKPGRRSRSPDRRYHRDTDEHDHGYSESDNEKGSIVKVKERDKDVYRDDKSSKGKDRSSREIRPGRRSRSPERRHHRDTDELDRGYSESDSERGSIAKGKERDKDVYQDDRPSKGKDSGWRDRSKDREPSKDNWKRSHSSRQERDHRDGDIDIEYENERDSKRREQDWVETEKLNSRPAYRKDNRSRANGMHTSSFANPNEHSDTIEIRPNDNLDFGREDMVQSFQGRRTEASLPQENTSGAKGLEWRYQVDDRGKKKYDRGDDLQERYPDDGSPVERTSRRNSLDGLSVKSRGQKTPPNSNGTGMGQVSANGSQSSYGISHGSGSHIRSVQQGPKGGRHTRGGRGRPMGRDNQRVTIPLPMMGPPFGHLALPPGPMPPLGPNMPPSPGQPIGPNVFIPPFPGPVIWPGARGVDMNMLAVPPSFPPIPPGPVGPRFAPNMASVTNQEMFFNQSGSGRGISLGMPGPGFNSLGSAGRGMPHDKVPTGWVPLRNGGPAGKAPSRGEQNDYSQNFVDTGMRPQNFIRELELTSTVEDYPKLRELIQKKDEIVTNSASPPMYCKCDLREHVLSPEFFGTKFDVILVDPPWEEYVHRAPGVADHMDYWTFEEILNLKIEAIADTPSFIFLWVGDGVGLEQGRQCLKKWGFRRCEDICWVKTNKSNAAPSLRHDSHTLFQHSKEHCLMGIKGTVRRSTDGHIIHANIDTDIIIAEEPPYGSTTKPEDIYRIIEHFSLGRRRLELFGEDHNIRPGWLTIGKDLSSTNFNAEAYCGNFADKDGKVWQGGGGRNPPPDAPHLVLTTPDIESLRPKSPPAKNQQQQQQSTSLSTTVNSSKRPAANSPQNPTATSMLSMNQGVSSSIPPNLMPWSSSQIGNYTVLEPGNADSDDKFFDNYGFNPSRGQTGGDNHEFDVHRPVNLL